MHLQQILISYTLVTIAQSASLQNQDSNTRKLTTEHNRDSRSRLRRSILSSLFNIEAVDYPTIIAGHLLNAHMSSSSNDNTPTARSTASQPRFVSAVGKALNSNRRPFTSFNPQVKVTVESEHISEFISVALMPDMSTYDSINAAKNLYAYRNPDVTVNPFSISVRVLPEKRCAIIDNVAGYNGTWNVFVTDHRRQMLHGDICIPRRSLLTMRPGYSIAIRQAETTVNSNQLVPTTT